MSSTLAEPKPWLLVINALFGATLVAGSGYWLYTADTFGIAMGLAGFVCAFGVFKRARWGYFAAGVWYFGLLRLAVDQYSGVYSEVYKNAVRGVCFIGVIVAIILHETVAKETLAKKNEQRPSEDSL